MTKKLKRRHIDYETSKNRGYYAMHRGWMNHPIFGSEPYSLCEAWSWLIEEATFSYEGRITEFNGCELVLKRGQLAFAYSFIANAWGWHKSRVGRFLKKLQRHNMIETQTGTDKTVLTICNYNKYQADYRDSETQNETQAERLRDVSRTNYNKENKGKKDKNCNNLQLNADLFIDLLSSDARHALKRSSGGAYFSFISQLTYDQCVGTIVCPNTFVAKRLKDHNEQDIRIACKQSSLKFSGLVVA